MRSIGRRGSREALELVGLQGLGDRLPGTLSGGQQQRVALARALAPRPTVLLLDEPFSNLDTSLRVQVRAEVHALLLDLGITSVFVTHDQDEAFVLGDHVAVMSGGRIVQAAPPSELYARPVSPWVATFVGDANLVAGDAAGDRADTPLGPIPLVESTSGPVQVLVRPEAVALGPGRGRRRRGDRVLRPRLACTSCGPTPARRSGPAPRPPPSCAAATASPSATPAARPSPSPTAGAPRRDPLAFSHLNRRPLAPTIRCKNEEVA